jgi:hypothetical protein
VADRQELEPGERFRVGKVRAILVDVCQDENGRYEDRRRRAREQAGAPPREQAVASEQASAPRFRVAN